MKNSFFLAGFLFLPAAFTYAQANPATPSSPGDLTRVAVIDIGKVFKQHPRFNQAMEAMKRDVQKSQTELQNKAKEIDAQREKLRMYKSDSVEAKQTEATILELQAAGQLAATKKKKDLLDREAKLYFEVYEEIKQEVNAFMKQYGIALVLRFNSDSIDVRNRPAVLEYVNRPIVDQRRIDITAQIVERVARRHNTTVRAATGTPASTR